MAGTSVEAVCKELQAVSGVSNVLVADQDNLKDQLAEPLTDLLVALQNRSAQLSGSALSLDLTDHLTASLLVQAEV